MKNKFITAILAAMAVSTLSSCLIYQGVKAFVRDDYPGDRPAKVIKDVNGKPASQSWKSVPSDYLPPSSNISTTSISKADDGIPYGINSEYEDIILSPHYPHHLLDYRGFAPGDKVWDPYTRKPFYISRSYTFN